jgi:hypothetical protein
MCSILGASCSILLYPFSLSALVAKHVKKENSNSMGFCFVEFDYVETATGVCKDLHVCLVV